MGSTVEVVVVDDQATFLAAARAVVGRTPDFVVVGEAADGAGALRVIEAVRPGLVLMDVQMPILDGVETARRLIEADAPCVIVLMSSYQQHDLPGDLVDARVSFIPKEDLSPLTLAAAWRRASSSPTS